jgi:hypothetical protein
MCQGKDGLMHCSPYVQHALIIFVCCLRVFDVDTHVQCQPGDRHVSALDATERCALDSVCRESRYRRQWVKVPLNPREADNTFD